MNYRSVYVRFSENREIITKNEILKGLSQKDLKLKEKFFNHLIMNILNDPYFDQLIMSVLNYVLPYQQQSNKLKKSLLLYWEIIDKKKNDGKMREEFMMVCNNLRKDLTHANEYVVGMSLKLIGRIALRDILDALLPPIYDKCLNHIESFVRRNAVECLFNLYENFGKNLLPDLNEKMVELLQNETDINTRRNAIVLLFKVSPLEALDFLIVKLEEENLSDFGDTTQLSIVQYLFQLCSEDSAQKSKYLNLLFEFMESTFPAVQFEICNKLINFTNNQKALGRCVMQLLNLLLNTPETNVQLIIIQQLQRYKKINKKLINENLNDFLKILEKEKTQIKLKCLSLILTLIDERSINNYLEIAQVNINNLYHKDKMNEIELKLHSAFIHSFLFFIKKKLKFDSQILLNTFINIILHNHKNKTAISIIKTMIKQLFKNKQIFDKPIGEVVQNKLLYIQSKELFKSCFYELVNEINDPKKIVDLLQKISELLDSLNKHIDKKKEVKEEQNLTMTKTVIREDGTYATEIVDSNVNKNIFQNDQFDTISKGLLHDSVFLVNFYRNILVLFSKVKEKNQKVNKIVGRLVFGLFTAYNYHISKKQKDKSMFKELNMIVKQLCGKNLKQINNHKYQESQNQNQVQEEEEKQNKVSDFNDILFFRQLKGKTKVDLEYEEKNIIEEKGDDKNQLDFNNKIMTLVQLTGYSDPIYTEAFVKFNNYNIDLEIFVQNRTDQILKNLTINFYSIIQSEGTNQNLRLMDKIKHSYLMPQESTYLCKTLQYDAAQEFKIFGEISYQNNAGIIQGYMKTNEINFQIIDFLENVSIESNQFRFLWQDCAWENIVKVKIENQNINEYVKLIQSQFKLFLLDDLSIQTKKFNSFSFYSRFVLGKDLLINCSIEVDSDNNLNCIVRLRSQNKGVVVLVGNEFKNIKQFNYQNL